MLCTLMNLVVSRLAAGPVLMSPALAKGPLRTANVAALAAILMCCLVAFGSRAEWLYFSGRVAPIVWPSGSCQLSALERTIFVVRQRRVAKYDSNLSPIN